MSTSDTQVLTPPPPISAPQLRRSASDRLIGGVCAGIGRRYGIDPVILRVVFVVAILAGGVGALAYLALWLLLPTDNNPAPDALTRNVLALVVGVLIAVAAVMAALGWLRSMGGFTGVLVGALLVGMAVWLYQQRERTTGVAMSTSPPSPEWAPPAGFAQGGSVQPGPYYPPPPQASTPPRERSYLGLITLLAAIVVGAGLAMVSAAGLVDVSIVGGMAAVLAVLAIGLLIGAFAGRARWLIILALPLALLLGVTAQVAAWLPTSMQAGIGDRAWTPTGPAEYRLGVGDATLDLTKWAARPDAVQPDGQTVTAAIGVGQLEVLVPRDWQAQVTAHTGAGEITINGDRVPQTQGNQPVTISLPATEDMTGSVRLNLSAEVGEISIRQVEVPTALPPPAATPRQPGQDRDTNPESKQGGAKNDGTDTTKENTR